MTPVACSSSVCQITDEMRAAESRRSIEHLPRVCYIGVIDGSVDCPERLLAANSGCNAPAFGRALVCPAWAPPLR